MASPSFTNQKIKETEELPPFSQEELQDSQHDNQTIEYLNQKSESIEEDQCEGNESDDISSKEEVVLASPSFTDQKIKETEEPQDSQHDNQTIENQSPITNISESKTTTFIEKPEEQEEKANHCIPDHHFCNQKSESIEKNQCEGNESDDISSKEEVVLASPSFTDQKMKTEELPPLSRKEPQDCQHDNQTIETITSINELKQTVCIENGDQEDS